MSGWSCISQSHYVLVEVATTHDSQLLLVARALFRKCMSDMVKDQLKPDNFAKH